MTNNEIIAKRWEKSMAKYNARPGNKKVAFTIAAATKRYLSRYHPEELPQSKPRINYKSIVQDIVVAFNNNDLDHFDRAVHRAVEAIAA